MSLIDEINQASSRINRVNQRVNENVQKVTRVTGGFENAVGNFDQSISNVIRTGSNTIRQFERTASSLGKIIGLATGNQPGIAGIPGTGGGAISGVVSAITSKGEAISQIANKISGDLLGSGVTPGVVRGMLGGLTGLNNEVARSYEDTIKLNAKAYGNAVLKFTNPYEKILQKKENQEVGALTFPIDLTQTVDSWLNLRFYEYSRPSSSDDGDKTPTFALALPIPNNFSQNYSVDIQPQDLGLLAIGMQGIDSAYASARSSYEEAASAGDAATEVITQLAGTIGENLDYAFYNKLNTMRPDIGGLVGQSLRQIPNPHPSLFFKGVNLRQFEWSWRFTPRSAEEAAQLRVLINVFKLNCLPRQEGNFLTYPKLVKPSLGGVAKDKMGEFKNCMVSGLSINYSTEGTSAFFRDGQPVSVTLDIQLQEVEQFLANDIGTF